MLLFLLPGMLPGVLGKPTPGITRTFSHCFECQSFNQSFPRVILLFIKTTTTWRRSGEMSKRWPCSACLGLHGSTTSTRVPHTPPPRMFQSAMPSQHTEGSGVGSQFHFFLFFYHHFWQMTPWQLEVKMLGLGGLNRFLSYRNKMCWIRQRQIFTFFFWTPIRALTNATPPPVRLWHDRFVFFVCVLVSRNVINVRGVKCIWHKQTLPSSKCT